MNAIDFILIAMVFVIVFSVLSIHIVAKASRSIKETKNLIDRMHRTEEEQEREQEKEDA